MPGPEQKHRKTKKRGDPSSYTQVLVGPPNDNDSDDQKDLEAQLPESLAEPKRPSFKTWDSGKTMHGSRIFMERYDLIRTEVVNLFNPFKEALSTSEGAGKNLYDTISKGFETDPGKGNGWLRFMNVCAFELASKGEGWEDPEKQAKDIKSLKNALRWSQKYELSFAAMNIYMALYDYESALNPGQLAGLGAYFAFQGIISAFVNYHGVNPEDAKGAIQPTIQIGNKIIDGTELRSPREGEEVHIKFVLDLEFVPDTLKPGPGVTKFNSAKVEFFNDALQLWLKQQENYTEYTKTNLIFNSDLLNTISFTGSNTHGAMFNWIGIVALVQIIMTMFVSAESQQEYSWIMPTVTLPFLPHVGHAGTKYYIQFTRPGMEKARKTIGNSDSALAQTFRISKMQGIEAMLLQWLPNACSRGFGFSLSMFVLGKILQGFFEPLFLIPNAFILAYSVFTGIIGTHNTALTRMRGAEKYLAPFTVGGFVKGHGFDKGKSFVVANPALLGELKELSPSETASGIFFAAISGAVLGGIPAFVLLRYAANLNLIGSIFAGLASIIPPAIPNFYAEKLHLQYTRARKVIEDKIHPPEKPPEEMAISVCKKACGISRVVAEGLIFGTAVGGGIYLIAGGDFYPLIIAMALIVFILKFASGYDYQNYKNSTVELKTSSPEAKGVPKLSEEDAATVNALCNLFDQASRAEAFAGSTQAFLSGFWAKLAGWQFTVGINSMLSKPRGTEFETYKRNTIEHVTNALNGIREKAGTPLDQIIGGYQPQIINWGIKFGGYKLRVINNVIPAGEMKRDELYVYNQINPLNYTCIGRNGKIIKGIITRSELPIAIKGTITEENLKEYLPDILAITGNRGDTLPEGRAVHFAARQLAFYFPYIFGREISGVSDQSWASWLCGSCSGPSRRDGSTAGNGFRLLAKTNGALNGGHYHALEAESPSHA